MMIEDGARVDIEITLWNKLVSESLKRDESDPNVKEVTFYNDIAAMPESAKKHYEHYKGKLCLWNDDVKDLLRSSTAASKEELIRRVDDVVELYFDPCEMVKRDPEKYTCPYCGGYDDECTLCDGKCVKDPFHDRTLYGTHILPDEEVTPAFRGAGLLRKQQELSVPKSVQLLVHSEAVACLEVSQKLLCVFSVYFFYL